MKIGVCIIFWANRCYCLGHLIVHRLHHHHHHQLKKQKKFRYIIKALDPQNPTYEIVTGPGYGNDIYQNVNELTS